MSRKIRLLAFIIVVVSFQMFGQSDSSVSKRPLVNLKLVPSAFANITIPAAQVGVEYRIYKDFYMNHEFGWMIDEAPYLWRRGYRHLSEARYYFDDLSTNNFSMFMGWQLRNWYFNAVDEGIFCRQNCLFTQTLQYEIDQKVFSQAFSTGFRSNLFSNRVFIEMGCSFGSLTRTNTTNLPDDVELAGFNLVFFDIFGLRNRWDNYKRKTGNMRLHFRIGYSFY